MDVQECLVFIGHQVIQLHGLNVSGKYPVGILQPVQLLNHDRIGFGNEFHSGQVVVAGITRHVKPAGFFRRAVIGYGYNTNLYRRIGGTRLGIRKRQRFGIQRIYIVNEVEHARAFRI